MDDPPVAAHPVLIFLGFLLLGLGLDWSWPIAAPGMTEAGIALLLVGIGLAMWAIWTMRQLGTEVDPYRTPTRLVVIGPYKFTRNPIYLGWAPALVGAGLLFETFWPLLLLPALYGIIHYGVVLREEEFLKVHFGEPYEQYCGRVRRWL